MRGYMCHGECLSIVYIAYCHHSLEYGVTFGELAYLESNVTYVSKKLTGSAILYHTLQMITLVCHHFILEYLLHSPLDMLL